MATVLHPAPRIASNEGVRDTLVTALGSHVLASKEQHGEIVIGVEREAIEDALRTLRDEHGYQQLMEIAGVDYLTGTYKPNAEKLSEYECGFPAFEDPRSQFDVRFYLIAILFIVFDLEAAFLFPWAVSLNVTKWPGWVTMIVFLFELIIGYAYAWKKGALEWE